jgi:hypothetical protein
MLCQLALVLLSLVPCMLCQLVLVLLSLVPMCFQMFPFRFFLSVTQNCGAAIVQDE